MRTHVHSREILNHSVQRKKKKKPLGCVEFSCTKSVSGGARADVSKKSAGRHIETQQQPIRMLQTFDQHVTCNTLSNSVGP